MALKTIKGVCGEGSLIQTFSNILKNFLPHSLPLSPTFTPHHFTT